MASGVLTGTNMIKKHYIRKRVNELTEGYMVTDAVFKPAPTDALSIVYDYNAEGLNSWHESEEVEERTEKGMYPRIGMEADEKQAMIRDYGLEIEVSYKSIKHNQIATIDRAYMKLGNSLMKFVDTMGLEKLTDDYNMSSTTINTYTAGTAWNDTGADPFSTLVDAAQKAKDAGYDPDVALVSPADWNAALKNRDFRQELDTDVAPSDKIVKSGLLKGKVNGLLIIESKNLTAGYGWVGQREVIGDRAENTSGVQTDSYKINNSEKSPTAVSAFREYEDILTDPKAGTLVGGLQV